MSDYSIEEAGRHRRRCWSCRCMECGDVLLDKKEEQNNLYAQCAYYDSAYRATLLQKKAEALYRSQGFPPPRRGMPRILREILE